MKLAEVLRHMTFRYARGAGDSLSVTDVAYDSRHVVPGALFVCVPGAANDGHLFAPDAVRRGASALIVERELDLAVPQVVVSDARDALAQASANFFGNASAHMQVAGVTGTAGKTTVAMLLEHMLNEAGTTCGLLGTVCYRMGERVFPSRYTTPESRDLQEVLGAMRDMGARAASMEVSSHALLTRRCAHTQFDVAAFTNLSREHMDLHGDMEDYFATKVRLFTEEDVSKRVICTSSRWGRRLADMLRDDGAVVVEVSGDSAADVFLQDVVPRGLVGSDVRAVAFGREMSFGLPMIGAFNAMNALVALSVMHELGYDVVRAAESLSRFPGVPGRMERVDTGGRGFTVLVDYAHTPEELGRAIEAASFGCGGDRDRGKRPMMGREASRADFVMVTNDNPRSENPADIAAETIAGMGEDASRARVQLDRRRAIRDALAWARPGDVVLIAGKGHESTQTVGGKTIRFDDREVTREELENV